MANIISMEPYRSRQIRSMCTLPLGWVSVDLEYHFDSISKRYEPIEISFWDMVKDEEIFTTKIRITDPSSLTDWRKNNGYNEETFINAPTMAQLDKKISYMFKGSVGIFWNKQYDLQHYPMLATHFYQTKCCMTRYSNTFGTYSPDFNDRQFDKLHVAASKAGIYLDENETFHTALTDVRVCSQLWKYCNEHDLPSSPIPNELILRKDADEIIEQLELDLQEKENQISLLEDEIQLSQEDSDLQLIEIEKDSEDLKDIPF